MSIQVLIDAASPGGTVNAAPGIYLEQLVIDKPLTLEGPDPSVGEAIVDAAGLAVAPTLLITSSQVTVRRMTFQNGPGQGIRVGTAAAPNLQDVVIEESVIQGHDYAGIMNINGSALDVINNLIENNGNVPSFERAGVLSRAHGQTNILNNSINNNGDGIYAEGSNAGLLVEGNTIENEFSSGVTLAWDEQNATIKDNTIRECGLATDDLKGGIVIIQALAEIITGNTIENCKQRGIMWAWSPSTGPEPESILISANKISHSSHDAIYLFSQGPGSFLPPDPYALKPLISDNQLLENGNAGVFVSNVFMGNPTGKAEPHLENNIIQDNLWGAFNETATVIDALNNWWGDASGPYHPLLNPDGAGNPVSDRINFIPWLEQPPLPSPVEMECITARKIYWRCQKFQVAEEVFDVAASVRGEIFEVQPLQAKLVVDREHPFRVEKIAGTERVRISFYYNCTVKFVDHGGPRIITAPPIFYDGIFEVGSQVRDQRIEAGAEIYLDCLECFVSGRHRITCCIGLVILLQLTAAVQLLIPTLGFCPEPDSCLPMRSECPDYLIRSPDPQR